MRAYRPSSVDGEVEDCAEEFTPPDRETTLKLYAERVEAGLPLFEAAGQTTIMPKRSSLLANIRAQKKGQPAKPDPRERVAVCGLLLAPWYPGNWSGCLLAEGDAIGLELQETAGR